MAWGGSGLVGPTQMDQWDPSALAIDLTAEDSKAAFYGLAVTPAYDSDTAYNVGTWATANESSGAAYTAGGILVTGTTLAVASGVMKYDYDNFEIPNSTFAARGYLHYFPNKSNRAFSAVDFGADDLETQDGTWLVTHDPSGTALLDYIPA